MDSAQKHVAMAVDMAIAEKAEVFVGNGVSAHVSNAIRRFADFFLQFSSLSGNVVTLRLSRGFKPKFNQFL